MIIKHNLFDIIIIIISFNILYKNFKVTIASILKTKDKAINKILSIIKLKKPKYKVKKLNRQLKYVVMAVILVFYRYNSYYQK